MVDYETSSLHYQEYLFRCKDIMAILLYQEYLFRCKDIL